MKKHIETKIEGNILRGYFETPDDGKSNYPLIVLFHGFTGDCTENLFMFARLAGQLKNKGIATLRLSFPGSGESDGDFSYVSCKTWGETAKKIFEFAKALPNIDLSRIGILGLSMGGAAATIAAEELKKDFKLLILIAPAYRYAVKYQEEFSDPETETAYKGNLAIKRHFIDDEKTANYVNILKQMVCPVRFIHGTGDTSVPFSVSELYSKYPKDSVLVPIANATHAFDDPKSFNALVDEVLRAASILID
ncbi:MAG: alpha/beta fold hydrolase [Clostridiaceae bacterium]